VSDQKGQFLVESILLMVVFLGIFIAGTKSLRENHFLSNLIERPWAQVQGMIECGVWGPPKTACRFLPNQPKRSLSLDPTK
jgi:hypothetical protein